MRTYSAILLALLLLSGSVFAGQASQASTNSGETGIFNIFTADTLDKGKWSFGVFGENIDREDKNLDINNFSFAFAYGVSDRVELAGSWNFLTRTKFNQIGQDVTNNDVPIAINSWNQGVGDFQVGGKVNLMMEDEGSPVGLAVRAFLKFPTADDRKSLGTGAASGGGDLVVSKTLGTCSVLAFNAGLIVNGDNEEIKILNTARVGAGVDVHVAGGLHAIAELRALPLLGNGDEDRSTPVDLSAGFEYELSNGMSFGAMYRNNVAWDADSNATKQGAVGFIRFGTPSECVAPPPPPPPPAPEPTPPPPPPPPAPEPPKPPEVTPVQPKMPPADVVLTDVHFKFDRYDLTEEAQGIIKDAAKFLQEYPDVNCQIEGHCCSIGTEEYNMALGQRRADAVRNYLISAFNIDANRLTMISYGESKPMYDNSRESTRKLNRRAHFNILIQ